MLLHQAGLLNFQKFNYTKRNPFPKAVLKFVQTEHSWNISILDEVSSIQENWHYSMHLGWAYEKLGPI